MSILTLQRRFRELGRIRSGKQEPTGRDGKMRPVKLYTFRLTSPSRSLIEAAAQLYGGTVVPWVNNDREQWEVITETDSLPIIIPPGQVLSQFMEMWSGGGCVRRCDGITELLTEQACPCPDDADARREMASKGKACKPTTRLNVILREIPDLGVWRLESHGWYAAVELAGTASILEMATQQGQMLPATLRLDPREKREPGKPVNKWVVPVIEIGATLGQVTEALGMIEPRELGATPVRALPSGGPVPVNGRAALPAAPTGRARTSFPDSPDLPDDPSFAIDVVVEEEPPPVTPLPQDDDKAIKRSQQLHISARNSQCSDLLPDLVAHVTDGRSTSTKDVTDDEASKLQELFYRIGKGKLTVSYDQDGKVVLT